MSLLCINEHNIKIVESGADCLGLRHHLPNFRGATLAYFTIKVEPQYQPIKTIKLKDFSLNVLMNLPILL